jgi:membrane associated rhomboid family serine protease
MISLAIILISLIIHIIRNESYIHKYGLNDLNVFYKALTCNFIYKDWKHLIGDCMIILCFMLPFEFHYGPVKTLAIFLVLGYFTNIIEYKFNCKDYDVFIGSSGPSVIFGTIMLLQYEQYLILSIIIFIVSFCLIKKKFRDTGHLAHLMGIFFGFILYCFFLRV